MAPERRRGRVLEEAILDAAWDLLRENGYHDFTIEKVAARAGTSKPVLYRRWPDSDALLRTTLRRAAAQRRLDDPDTGSLRGDVLALMRQVNQTQVDTVALVAGRLAEFYSSTGSTPASVLQDVAPESVALLMTVFERAAERGELNPARATRRVALLPFDLLRNELLLNMQPASDEVILEIVDDIFLPLVGR